MANGRGALECCYCKHYRARDGGVGYGPGCSEGSCTFWNTALPVIADHRICAEFTPNAAYAQDNAVLLKYRAQTVEESVRMRMAWFERDLRPGVLYRFCYNVPTGITELMELAKTETDPTSHG